MAGAMRAKSSSSRKPERSRCESMRGDARQEAQDQLLLAHLQAEDADRLALADGGVLGDVEGEAGLADAGPGGQDDEVARLEAGGQLVQVREARRDADDLAAVGVEVVQPVVGVVEERPQRAEAVVRPALADREQLGLRPVDRLLDVRAVLVADGGDLAGGRDEAAQDGLALDDAGVLGDVDGGGGVVAEAGRGSRRRRRPPARRRAPAPPRR